MIVVMALVLLLQAPVELKQRVDAGLKAKAAGDLNTAIREFQRVVELAPNLPAAYVNLGAVYFQKKDYGNAVQPLRKAVELNPGLPGAKAMLGAALLAQGYAMESIPYLRASQSDDLLGVALLETGSERDAVDKLEAALLKRPDDPDLLYYLSRAHERLAKLVGGKLVSGQPDSARAHQLLGEARAASGDPKAAERDFRAALAIRADLRAVHFALGELYLSSGDYESAEREFREEARLAPGSAPAGFKLGVVLLNRGQVREAIAELTRADSLHPDMVETLLELAKAAAASGDLPAAETFLRRVITREPSSTAAGTAHYQLAQIYRQLGRSADAERETKLFQQARKSRQ